MKTLLTLVLLLALGGLCWGSTINLTGLPANTYGGYYVGPAFGNLDGTDPLQVVCNDFNHTSYIPSSFDVNISTIPSLAFARFGNDPAAVERYERASWLMWQMGLNPGQVGPIQYALWNIFTPSAPDPAGTSTWLTAANAIDVNAFDYSGVRIYTPTGQFASNQEFMGGDVVPTPEPATMQLVLGAVLIFVPKALNRLRR